jgi:iduronate 2-sulfatase
MRASALSFLLSFSTVALNAAPPDRPNILFIAVDDLKPELGCYGNGLIRSPGIDRLAEQGTVFLNAHCQQAVCAPSRASIMTGMRPDHTRVWDLKTQMRDMQPDILTLPAHLRAQGYTTAGIGKIFDYRAVDAGQDTPSWSMPFFQVEPSYYHEQRPPALHWYQSPANRARAEELLQEAAGKGLDRRQAIPYAHGFLKPSVESADVPDDAYFDGAMTKKAIDILDQLAQRDAPFFLAVGYHRPHLPFAAPEKYWNLYRREDMPLAAFRQKSAGGPSVAYHNSGELRSYTDIPPVADTPGMGEHTGLPEEKQRELIHGYYAAVSYIDAQIGLLLDRLEALGLRDNTVIVLWGDHGWHLGDHDLWCKHSNFEQATRSPLIISAPWLKAGKSGSVVEFVDVFPTLCELAGMPVPGHLHGSSLVPVMKNKGRSVKPYAVSQFPRGGAVMGYTLRTERYRYTAWLGEDYRSDQPYRPELFTSGELYDYRRDLLETNNVLDAHDYRRVRRKLEALLGDFFAGQRP